MHRVTLSHCKSISFGAEMGAGEPWLFYWFGLIHFFFLREEKKTKHNYSSLKQSLFIYNIQSGMYRFVYNMLGGS